MIKWRLRMILQLTSVIVWRETLWICYIMIHGEWIWKPCCQRQTDKQTESCCARSRIEQGKAFILPSLRLAATLPPKGCHIALQAIGYFAPMTESWVENCLYIFSPTTPFNIYASLVTLQLEWEERGYPTLWCSLEARGERRRRVNTALELFRVGI